MTWFTCLWLTALVLLVYVVAWSLCRVSARADADSARIARDAMRQPKDGR